MPRGAFVQVKRRGGGGVTTLLRAPGERLESPPALLGSAVGSLERRARGEHVRDEAPVAAKLVHDRAEQLVLGWGPRPGLSRARALGFVRLLLVPAAAAARVALVALLAPAPRQRRQGNAVLILVAAVLVVNPARPASFTQRCSLFQLSRDSLTREVLEPLRLKKRPVRRVSPIRDARDLRVFFDSASCFRKRSLSSLLAFLPITQTQLVHRELPRFADHQVSPEQLGVPGVVRKRKRL